MVLGIRNLMKGHMSSSGSVDKSERPDNKIFTLADGFDRPSARQHNTVGKHKMHKGRRGDLEEHRSHESESSNKHHSRSVVSKTRINDHEEQTDVQKSTADGNVNTLLDELAQLDSDLLALS